MKDISGKELQLGDLVVFWRLGMTGTYLNQGYAIVASSNMLWSDKNLTIYTSSADCYLCRMTEEEIKLQKKLSKAYNEFQERKVRRGIEAAKFTVPGMYAVSRGITTKDKDEVVKKQEYVLYLGKVNLELSDSYYKEFEGDDKEEVEAELADIYKKDSYAYLYFYGTQESLEAYELISFITTGELDVKRYLLFECDITQHDDMKREFDRSYRDCELVVQAEPLTGIDKLLGTCRLDNWNIGDTHYRELIKTYITRKE